MKGLLGGGKRHSILLTPNNTAISFHLNDSEERYSSCSLMTSYREPVLDVDAAVAVSYAIGGLCVYESSTSSYSSHFYKSS